MIGVGRSILDKFEVDSSYIDQLYTTKTLTLEWPMDEQFTHGELCFLEAGSQSILVKRVDDTLVSQQHLLKDCTAWGIQGRSVEQKIALNYLLNPLIPCVSLIGKAGSGKTLLAIAAALEQRSHYLKILVARPAVSLGNAHDLGYIPGGVDEKLAPWTMPIFDNLSVLKQTGDAETIKRMTEEKKIEMCPLQYIRGRSLFRCFVIIDEAQNLRPEEIKTIGTRIGEGSKVVFTGDTDQIDKHYLRDGKDGMTHLISRTKGHPLCADVKLKRGERSELANLLADIL